MVGVIILSLVWILYSLLSYNVHDPIGLPLLTRTRVNLSNLREHKFKHMVFLGFQDSLVVLIWKSVEHFLIRCLFFAEIRSIFLDNLSSLINEPVSDLPDVYLINLLYDSKEFPPEVNTSILKGTILFGKTSGRFDTPLL